MEPISSNLAQDEAKIIIQILSELHYQPKDARIIIKIIDSLEATITQPDLKVPTVTISPNNINLKIDHKAK